MSENPKISIVYCPKCGWLMRATWIAQEILTTFVDEISEVALKPSEIGGVFDIFLNDDLVFSRKSEGHFSEMKQLKQIIRDIIAPEKSLGHSDTK